MEKQFLELVASLAFALPVVFGLVEFLKSVLSLEGKSVTLMSFLVGIVISGLVFWANMQPEVGVYVAGGVFIVASGLVASGFYKFAAVRWPKAED